MFKLDILNNYYWKNRQVGHTTAMLNGAKSDKNILVVITRNTQKSYIDLPKEQFINITYLQEGLIGKKNPVVVEHFALQLMWEEVRKELTKKDIYIDKLEKELKNNIK